MSNVHGRAFSDHGIMISYDKDDKEDRGGNSKRQMEEMRRQKAALEASYCRCRETTIARPLQPAAPSLRGC